MAPRAKRTAVQWANEFGPHGLGLFMLIVIFKVIVNPMIAQIRDISEKQATVAQAMQESAQSSREAAQASLTAARVMESVAQQLRDAEKGK